LGTPESSRMSESLASIWQDPAEAVGELLLEKGLDRAAPALSQVPLLSLAIAAYKSKGAISDYLLTRKVQQFYSSWDHLSHTARRDIFQKFQKKPRAFVEKLLFILAQQEDLEKCELLGVLTTSHLQGKLKRALYMELIETVSHLSLGDLLKLSSLLESSLIFPAREVGERYAALFIPRGLIVTEKDIPREQWDDDTETSYSLTAAGRALAEHVQICELGDD
jgi:hypothetical protein